MNMGISKLVVFLLFVSTALAAEALTPLYFEEDTGCWVYIDSTSATCPEDESIEYLEYLFSVPDSKIGNEFDVPYIYCHTCKGHGYHWYDLYACPSFYLNGYEIALEEKTGWGMIHNPDLVLKNSGNLVEWEDYKRNYGHTHTQGVGADSFKICLYYPLIEIELTSSLPAEIYSSSEVIIEGTIKNIGDVNAEEVTVKLKDSDFDYEPSSFSFDLMNQNEGSNDREKKIRFTLTPKTGSDKETNYELNGINFGKIIATFKDFKDGKREAELEIGSASYTIETEEEEETAQTAPLVESEEENQLPQHTQESQCAFAFIAPLLLALVVLRGRV